MSFFTAKFFPALPLLQISSVKPSNCGSIPRKGERFLSFFETSIGALIFTYLPVQLVPKNFIRGSSGQSTKRITQLHLVSRWQMCVGINPFNYVSTRHSRGPLDTELSNLSRSVATSRLLSNQS